MKLKIDNIVIILGIIMLVSIIAFAVLSALGYEFAAWFFVIAFIVAYVIEVLVIDYAHKAQKDEKRD